MKIWLYGDRIKYSFHRFIAAGKQIIASPIAFLGMHRWLQGYAYRIDISWWTFVLASIITLAISILTISLRVIRAALLNPTDNLRSE